MTQSFLVPPIKAVVRIAPGFSLIGRKRFSQE
jgi:hypothetical protein